MDDKVNIIMLAFFKTGNGNPRTLSFGNLFDVIREAYPAPNSGRDIP